jgi:hypothetical protein
MLMARCVAQDPSFTGTKHRVPVPAFEELVPDTGPAIAPAEAQYGCDKDYVSHTSAAGESHYWGIALGVNKKRLLPGAICCTADFE